MQPEVIAVRCLGQRDRVTGQEVLGVEAKNANAHLMEVGDDGRRVEVFLVGDDQDGVAQDDAQRAMSFFQLAAAPAC